MAQDLRTTFEALARRYHELERDERREAVRVELTGQIVPGRSDSILDAMQAKHARELQAAHDGRRTVELELEKERIRAP